MTHAPGIAASSIRVLIADDHTLFRKGIRQILELEPGVVVVGEAVDGDDALRQVAMTAPDVLLLDLQMPRRTGFEVLAALAETGSSVKTVLLSGAVDRVQTIEAFRIGARGVLRKDADVELLVDCLHNVTAGRYWMEQDVVTGQEPAKGGVPAGQATGPEAKGDCLPPVPLTRRELQVVAAIVDGASNDDIGQRYGMRTQTVKNHLTNIFDKLGVSSRLELAMFAVSHHLIERVGDAPARPTT